VLVSGSRLGTLRFLDITGFAAGLWAGIELDEPVGKNDGCVAGTRLVLALAVFAPKILLIIIVILRTLSLGEFTRVI